MSAIAAVVLAGTGGAAYVVLGHATHRTSAQGTSPSPGGASRSATTAVTHQGDLRRYLIAPPAGSHPWPHPLGTHRKLSLRQAARLATDSKTRRTALTRDHFRHGAVQCWTTNGGTWADVRLYQFGSAADARDFYRHDIEASSAATPASGKSTVSKVPGAEAFADPKPDSEGYVSVVVVGIKGDVAFVIDVAEHSGAVHLATPDRLTREQYSEL